MSATTGANETQDPWLPTIVIAMGQALRSFNVAALPVSMGGMVSDFGVPPHHRRHGAHDVFTGRFRIHDARGQTRTALWLEDFLSGGGQQANAPGWLGSARAMTGVLAFLIIGTLERFSEGVQVEIDLIPGAANLHGPNILVAR